MSRKRFTSRSGKCSVSAANKHCHCCTDFHQEYVISRCYYFVRSTSSHANAIPPGVRHLTLLLFRQKYVISGVGIPSEVRHLTLSLFHQEYVTSRCYYFVRSRSSQESVFRQKYVISRCRYSLRSTSSHAVAIPSKVRHLMLSLFRQKYVI
ncbi:hypothetical protein BaRGS_00029263 [Batillaria attramentaria]|uniref:Uncharacterized protein n=1 Tax=Batillaria attramentaria TaxID=370345 RepID=A0ABD0JXM7_9CAEN